VCSSDLSISLLRKFPTAFQQSTAYVVDSHRPINFENIDCRVERIKVFDDSQSIFDELCDLPDSELDDEHTIIIEGRQRTRMANRLVQKRIDPESAPVLAFLEASRFSDPAALQLYSLAAARNQTSLLVLWFAILGLTEHFLLEHVDSDRYEVLFNALQNEASRLTNGVQLFTTIHADEGDIVSPVAAITVPVAPNLFIQPCLDLRFNLMRHWTLMEAMKYSPFVTSRLRLWTHDGNERLQILLAKMGVPLRDANTAYIAMSSDLRDSLVRRFDAHCDAQNLTGGHFASFLLKRGFVAPLAASDVVYAVRARLAGSADFGSAFAETFAVIRMAGNQTLLSDGVESAKVRTKQVISLGIELMNRRASSIVNAGTFRITYIHNAAERQFPVEASALVDLGQFLIQAYRANGDPILPIVVASIDQATQQWLVVAVSTAFEFGDVEASKFGTWFMQAAKRAEIEIELDSFDSFICQVPNDLLLAFVDQLTLVASH
jgi:cell division control protein 45